MGKREFPQSGGTGTAGFQGANRSERRDIQEKAQSEIQFRKKLFLKLEVFYKKMEPLFGSKML